MKKILYPLVAVLICFLVYCTKDNIVGNDKPTSRKDSVSIAANILFKQKGIQVAPDSVTNITLTVSYGQITMTDTIAFSAHHGTMAKIPVNTAFILKIEGLDASNYVIYSGTQHYSGFDDDASVTINADQVTPRAPSNLHLTAQTATTIEVTWKDNSRNELGFLIERSKGNDSNFVVIDTGLTDQPGLFDNDSLTAATIYYYRVRAYNNAGNSPYLTAQAIQTPANQVIDSIPPHFTVAALPESVSVDSITITGKAYDTNGISLVTVNGDSAILGADSGFSKKIGLRLGRDTVTVVASDNSSRKNDTTITRYVVYDPTASDNQAPTITVTAPADSDTVGNLTRPVSGTVNDAGSGVDSFWVNGSVVAVSGITWSTNVTLPGIGWQSIRFAAKDARNNRSYDTIRVFVDTSTLDTVKPSISFGGLTQGYHFSTPNPTITIQVTENGSGIDTVYIGNGVATLSGSDYSRAVTLTPDSNTIIVVVKDKTGNRGRDSVLVILNRPPQFTTLPANMTAQVNVGQQYKDTVIATDPDGATGLIFTKQAGPSDMTVGIASGIITWTPTGAVTVQCTVIVSDKYQAKDTIAWSTSALSPSSVLVAYYPFSGNANDASGNGHNGTVSGAVLTNDRFGTPQSAYQFDGSKKGITAEIGIHSALSISAWIKPHQTNNYYPTTFRYDNSLTVISGLLGPHPTYVSQGRVGEITGGGLSTTSPMLFDKWYHVVVISCFASDSVYFYIDGAEIGRGTGTVVTLVSDTFWIGRQQEENPGSCGGCGYFDGETDDIGIYAYALSQTQIDSLYHVGGWIGNNNVPYFSFDSASMTSSAIVGSLYKDTVHALDSDSDLLSFIKLTGPATLSITDSIINWTPTSADTGMRHVSIQVSDGKGGYDTLGWTITVTDTFTQVWTPVGQMGFTAGSAEYISLNFDDSTPYVSFRDYANGAKATTMRCVANNWEIVGNAGFSDAAAGFTSIAIDNHLPFVAYEDDQIHGYKGTVMSYNGSSWSPLGGAGFTTDRAHFTCLAIYNHVPYMAFRDYSYGKISVMKYNATYWQLVGTAGFSNNATEFTSYLSFVIDSSGTTYAAYQDQTSGYKISAMKYTGSTWASLGVSGFSQDTVSYISLAVENTVPYVSFRDAASSGKGTVMKYTGTTWGTVGSPGFTTGAIMYSSIAVHNGNVYVAFSDATNGNKVTVMEFTGASWSIVAAPGISVGQANFISLKIIGGIAYITYQDMGMSGKASLMKCRVF
ncbi:MAG: hypothetical protein A2268_03015 [Candidatus Raymondbacteria bacterium RifOxyA12_full_50_37]|nr:MAG: hypothetical protein A2248_17120 [Candidatus Raymondbacteria bacterium RIFOXYA2_FULL_49_16]OGJ90748.1 MAG: hypothetical protein A2268_03015 [Candidatus Raymondbacteria bacterium RifOxyA12_full_50_37]OGJ98385.1 MAG: hypothetical protein A2453_09025 [Candidatus Raymondbacteria bacterium RIFOXYC2_FULL_50_21]OGK06605.1 MAG: hypothetical protein A2487_03025 [Candidatus Raymondbacteria bacterium RifOxyC12_full_50_8]OGP44110.1 MAG: hypothetical protein A2324_07200 [Candidatus Raymondbacteria b